jgi:hypothetical protein
MNHKNDRIEDRFFLFIDLKGGWNKDFVFSDYLSVNTGVIFRTFYNPMAFNIADFNLFMLITYFCAKINNRDTTKN